MARKTHGRIEVRGRLIAKTPLHVGGISDGPDTDLPLARDGGGDLYVPGTSLAGALRAWCEPRFDREWVDLLFGSTATEFASRLICDDGLLHLAPGATVEIRDGVGIDRSWGGAAPHIKYDRAVVPRRTRLELRLDLELPADPARARSLQSMLGHLLGALRAGRIQLGAATTRGLGWVALDDEDLTIRRRSLDSKSGLVEALRQGGRSRRIEDLIQADPDIHPRARPTLDIRVHWKPEGFLSVRAGRDGLLVDGLPLVSAVGDGTSLVLPGSSIKGALREQAERIVRSLLMIEIEDLESPRLQFLSDVQVPLVEQVFGSAGTTSEDASSLGLGALAIADCYAQTVFDRERWTEVVNATPNTPNLEPAALRARLDAAGLGPGAMDHAYHVAVDRWTGGAADGLLFSSLEPRAIDWEPLVLRVDLTRLADGDELAGLMLLIHLLNDLAAGWIRFGHDKKSGGRILLTGMEFSGEGMPASMQALTDLELDFDPEADARKRTPLLEKVPDGVREELTGAWIAWIERMDGGSR